jgi:hypothetical protein
MKKRSRLIILMDKFTKTEPLDDIIHSRYRTDKNQNPILRSMRPKNNLKKQPDRGKEGKVTPLWLVEAWALDAVSNPLW